MKKATHRKNQNRTIFINFHTKVKYHQLCQDGSAFIEFVTDFIISLGFQLHHRSGCTSEKIYLTRHSHYERVRLGNLQIRRVQCTDCDAVFTVLPHFVLRYTIPGFFIFYPDAYLMRYVLSRKLRRFVEAIKKLTNNENAERIKQWVEEKKNGWYILLLSE